MIRTLERRRGPVARPRGLWLVDLLFLFLMLELAIAVLG